MCASSREDKPKPGQGFNAAWLNPLRLPTLLLLAIIMFHRKVLSRLTPPTCRFTPSCSRYALDAVTRYGAVRGGWLAVWRVLRCNPINPGGYDPLI
ncbi:membrane protein insertion efficiency factor YidD [bacterium]|nr:membrane protein insertion efficiency factor YidD [bacterium]